MKDKHKRNHTRNDCGINTKSREVKSIEMKNGEAICNAK